jgi:hypothetical protein
MLVINSMLLIVVALFLLVTLWFKSIKKVEEIEEPEAPITDEQKKIYLLSLIRQSYPQGDDFYAQRHKKRSNEWVFGYCNDYPLQHGPGVDLMLTDTLLEVLIRRRRSFK